MSESTAEIRKKRPPIMTSHTTVINRVSGGGLGGFAARNSGGFRSSMGMSGGAVSNFQLGAAKQMSSSGVNMVLDARAKEKTAIQDLNRKLGKHIETSKFLEAQNKALVIELEAERKKKIFDSSSIRELFEQELEESRKIIADLETEKASLVPRIATLEEVADDEEKRNDTLEADIAARIKQIERLNTQVGDMEGENGTLRRTVNTHEDEIKRLKMNIQDYKQNLNDARRNLEEECRQRIELQLEKNLSIEERDFIIAMLTKENEELKKLVNADVGQIDIKNLWKGEITSCIKQLQDDNDRELEKLKQTYVDKYELQMQQLSAGQMKDNAELVKLQSEISRLKSKNVDQGPLIADLNARMNALKIENERLTDEMRDAQDRWEEERCQHMSEIDNLNAQLTELLARLRDIQDEKLSLESEISTYRTLLQGEEESIERFVTDSSGARSRGAESLSDLVQSSSSMGGGGGQFSSASEGKVFIKKKASGNLCIEEAHGSGMYVTLAYGTKDKRPSGSMSLAGWKVCRQMEGETNPCVTYEFQDTVLQPGEKIKIFGSNFSNDKSKRKGDLVANFPSWRTGGGKYSLQDQNMVEKGSLMIEFR